MLVHMHTHTLTPDQQMMALMAVIKAACVIPRAVVFSAATEVQLIALSS